MLAIFATVAWILFDVLFCVLTAPMMPTWEWWTFLIGGIGLGGIALAGEFLDRHAAGQIEQQHSREMADLKDKLTKQEGFNLGAFTAMSHRLDTFASTATNVEARQEAVELKAELATFPALEPQIVYDGVDEAPVLTEGQVCTYTHLWFRNQPTGRAVRDAVARVTFYSFYAATGAVP